MTLFPTGLAYWLLVIASELSSPIEAKAAELRLPAELKRPSAAVMIDGYTLFPGSRRGVSAYPAEQRARIIGG
ncbi:MAG TPA: hypothetical protein VJ805_05430 [Nitrospiraceae bacterium]|nr:hypothetical protein [Nitrospiraceae bacterium]